MKKFLLISCSIALAAFCSCSEEDFGLDSQNIQYETNFKRTFGEVPAGQNWDFYAQAMNNLTTRAISGEGVSVSAIKTYGSEMNTIISSATNTLPDGRNNGQKGQLAGELISSGAFSVYTVLYGGGQEKQSRYNFQFGIEYNNGEETLFTTYNGNNPRQYRDITIPAGEKYRFYIDFTRMCWVCGGDGRFGLIPCLICGGDGIREHERYYSDSEQCRTIYDNVTGETEQTMIMGFEDLPLNENDCDHDFNDFIVCLKGQLPMLEAKRYMCEDLGGNQSSDLDFNDIVFDIQPSRTRGTDVIVRAVGGTLPIKLYVNDQLIGNGELHEYFGGAKDDEGKYQPINVGKEVNTDPKTINLSNLTIDDLTTFSAIRAEVTYPTGVQEISFKANADGSSPRVFSVPVNTAWMLEDNGIKSGYSGYYQAENWWNNPTDNSKLYHE